MAFRDYCSELVGTIPNLPYPLAQTLVNRAWKDLRDLRLWSWLVDTDDIVTPMVINAGTVTVFNGSFTVACDATASAALMPYIFGNPPLASTVLGQGRQIRIGLTSSSGPIFNIVGVDATDPTALTLVIDRQYANDSILNAPYQVYRCYIAPPGDDFLQYITITHVRAGYNIRAKKLFYTQHRLNSIDPQRGAHGDAYVVSAFKSDRDGRPVHEWYPHPTNFGVYSAVYRKRGKDLSGTTDLPVTFPNSVLMARSYQHAADWAIANVGRYPQLGQTNWAMFREAKGSLLKEELVQAIKQDDEISPLLPMLQGSYSDFPLGGEFMQGHDVSSLLGGL